METRSRAAAETRGAIIDAAHRLLNQQDGSALTLQEVADAAGVSRATIYKSVGSRPSLLAAVLEDQGRLIEYHRVLAAMRLDDPIAAVVATVRESCRAWAIMPNAIRKTLALAVIDPEIGDLVVKYERYRRAELTSLASRIVKEPSLRSTLAVPYAAAVLSLNTSFPVFDHLCLEHSTRKATELLVRITAASLGIDNQPG